MPRLRTVLLSALLASIIAAPSSGSAQGTSPGGIYPTSCPAFITERFLGAFEFRYNGYTWPGQFRLSLSNIDSELIPQHQGYFVPVSGPNLISLNGRGKWWGAGIIVNCFREEVVDFGFITVNVYGRVVKYFGDVRPYCPPGGANGPTRYGMS